MFGTIKSSKSDVISKTVYMELFSDRKIAYRVTAGRTMRFGEEINIYGIEATDSRTGETERISDFSPDIEDAVAFAEMLNLQKARPKQLYGKALGYLRMTISAM
ncbi:MAG: hypothetical protein IIZ53_08030 [Ruminococcus sp.]|jgi:hypothetical protein|nr:hypothetical protein [Ruminococcus sp.]